MRAPLTHTLRSLAARRKPRPRAALDDALGGRRERPAGAALEFERVMAADHLHLAAMRGHQGAQAVLVVEASRPVLLHHPLIEPKPRRAVGALRVDLAIEEIRIARLQ